MAKTKKTETPKRKVAKTKRPYGIATLQVYEKVLYIHPGSGERVPAVVTGGPYPYTPEADGVTRKHHKYNILLVGDTHCRVVDEEDLLKEPPPKFKRGDLVKETENGLQGVVVRVTPKKDIGYRYDVFCDSSGVVQNHEEGSLKIDESESETP